MPRLQKRVIRLITFSCYIAHTSDLFKDMKIQTLSKLYILKVHIFMCKFENNTLHELFFVYVHNKQSNTYIPYTNIFKPTYTDWKLKMVYITGVKIWNNIKSKINISSNFLHYTFNLRQYLLAVSDIHCILK